MDGIERHGFERVDFFVHLHGADFGGERGTGTSDDDDGRHQRAEFARHRDGDGVRDHVHGAELAELVGALQGENCSDEKRNQGNDGKGFDSDRPSPDESARPSRSLPPRKRRDENGARGAAGQLRQAADVSEAIDRRFADRFG